jgi:hypothetical protein
MATIEALFKSGLSIREVSRKTGKTYGNVRHRLITSGLHRIKHKRIRNGMATCNRCGERKTLDQFPGLTYGTYRCQTCIQMMQETYQLRRLGCSNEKYQSHFNTQGGKCAICGVRQGHRSRYGKVCRLAVDHDHRTGKVRGLLCNNCNRGLGRFKDSIENLEAAIRYLKREQ